MTQERADNLDYLRTRILEEMQVLGDVKDLDLISDPDDRLVICRVKPASPETRNAFAKRFDGMAIGESVFFKRTKPALD